MSSAGSEGLNRLACPVCRSPLRTAEGDAVACTGCGHRYPLAGGVPVLLTDRSAFDAGTVAGGTATYYENRSAENRRKRRIRQALPGLASDFETHQCDALVASLLPGGDRRADGLVVGSGFRAAEYAERIPGIDWLVTDVEATGAPDAVADVLALPLPDRSQDVVVAEHVLEHVVDPIAAAREIERVLRPGGVVLAKIPFNHPWHGGFVDFFRVTPAGMLALFRRCEPVHVGHGAGPASTVAYAMQATWLSLFPRRRARLVASGVGRLAFGWLRHLDRWLLHRYGALSSTCSLAFVGRRTDHERTARELVAEARALGRAPVRPPAVGVKCR